MTDKSLQKKKLILPANVKGLWEKCPIGECHPGLQLDKYSRGGKQDEQSCAIKGVTNCHRDESLLEKLLEKRESFLNELGAEHILGKTVGPLTLHLSSSGALENAGIAMHPIYGFAWLPGTGIKGMTRAYAETVWKSEYNNDDEADQIILEAFGYSDESESNENLPTDDNDNKITQKVGRLVFHDAWPTKWPKLVRDIVNNHHTNYYKAGGEPPGDWEDPNPVYFLAIASDTVFDFAISDRQRNRSKLLKYATEWLHNALHHFGAGAKTAAGYGRIETQGSTTKNLPEIFINRTYELELVTPAFLAGANQNDSDCDLRVPSLRGVLRWWWRTMHASHINAKELAKLEELVWGSAEHSSPISISITPNANNKNPFEFDKVDITDYYKWKLPKKNRMIHGLYYLSYGMNEKMFDNTLKKSVQFKRQFMDTNSKWKLTVTVRNSYKDTKDSDMLEASAEILIEQFEASLWLLTNYGGVGSRSRKGFGSFENLDLLGISKLDDCSEIGEKFRNRIGISTREKVPESPSLEQCICANDIKLNEPDDWNALNRIGLVYQEFIKNIEPINMRKILGTPRGEVDDNFEHRHSSPAIWSLYNDENKDLYVRLISFPSNKLPDHFTSEKKLKELKTFIETTFDEYSKSISGNSNKKPRYTPISTLSRSEGLPGSGTTVNAVLLRRTKKGGWRVELPDRLMEGSISNWREMPSDFNPGDQVKLQVTAPRHENAIFVWLPDKS